MGRREQADASRARLVEAGRQCFAERGYEATTVAEVLRRTGMARGALYHYFPGGKRELFLAVFDTLNQTFHRHRDAVAALPSARARIREGLRVFLGLCTREDFARIVLLEGPRHVPGQDGLGSSYALLREELAKAQAAGELARLPLGPMARALYGAARSAGEFVASAPDRTQAVGDAMRVIDRILDGLAAAPEGVPADRGP